MAKKMNTDCPLQVECGKVCNHLGTENECSYYKANARPGFTMAKWDAKEQAEFEEREQEVEAINRPDSEMIYISVDDITPHPDNPRKDLGDLTELADSIKANGIFQNLTVVENGDGKYTVIIGHRRLAAAKLAGIEKVPCVVASLSPQEQFRTMMIENMQRSDLTNLEQADGFQMMLDLGDTKDMISEKTGFSKSTINKRLKLREFDREKIKAAELRGGTISDYLKLAEIKDEKARNDLLDSIGTNDFLNNLQRELNRQKMLDDKERIMPIVKSFATKMKNPGDRWGSKYQAAWNYRFGGNEEVKLPDPGDKTPYVYYDSDWDVYIYKPAPTKEKDKKSTTQINYEKWLKEAKDILKDICDRHSKLRWDFVNALSEGKLVRDKMYFDIISFAGKCLSGIYAIEFDRYYGREAIESEFNIHYEISYYSTKQEEKEEIWKKLNEKPVKLLLLEVMSGIESHKGNFWTENYTAGPCNSIKENEANVRTLKAEYEFLEKLGYQMSEEEKKTLDGSLIADLLSGAPPMPTK